MSVRASANGRGFTLVEMMVVLGVIVLLCTMALPSVTKLINSGADAQAYNVMAAQLAAARALAIQESNYAGVHVQMADHPKLLLGSPKLADACFSTVVSYVSITSSSAGHFAQAYGYVPTRMPGTIAFGEISADFVDGDSYNGSALSTANGLRDFTAFTVVFSPQGSLAEMVDTPVGPSRVQFNPAGELFKDGGLWDCGLASDELGVRAITLFDYVKLKELTDGSQRGAYLNRSGQILPINVYTGQLFRRN